MKLLIIAALIASSSIAFAGPRSTSSSSSALTSGSYNTTYSSPRSDYVWGTLGFANSAIALGGGYERMIKDNLGFGGMARIYTEGKGGSKNKATVVAGFIRPHLTEGNVDFYVSPGVGFGSMDFGGQSESTLIGMFTVGFTLEYNDKISLGADSTAIHGLTSDKIPGAALQDLMFVIKYKL